MPFDYSQLGKPWAATGSPYGDLGSPYPQQGTAPWYSAVGKQQSQQYNRGIYQDPWADMVQAQQRLGQDVYAGAADRAYYGQGGMGGAVDQYGQAINQFNQQANPVMNQMYQQSQGQNSIVQQEALAQRQQAMGDIARQAAMGARGGMNPAAQRAAILQQSNVGANMAAQVAAARAREQQEAQRAYLQARQQQLQNAQGLLSARQEQSVASNQRFGGAMGTGSMVYNNRMVLPTSSEQAYKNMFQNGWNG